LVPKGLLDEYRKINIPIDDVFELNPSDLSGIEWVLTFNLDPTSNISLYIQKIIKRMKENNNGYSMQDIISYIEKLDIDSNMKNAITTYFENADSWGLFSEKAESIRNLTKARLYKYIRYILIYCNNWWMVNKKSSNWINI